MVTLGGRKIPLAKGRRNRKAAEQEFYELAVVQLKPVHAHDARVVDLIEAFLTWVKTEYDRETWRAYEMYGQKFAERWGFLMRSKLTAQQVTTWLNEHDWNPRTSYNAVRSVYRIFSWVKKEQKLPVHPLAGLEKPRPIARCRALSEAEYRAMMKASDGVFKPLLFALWETGCRPKEARTLKWDNVLEDRWVLPQHKTVRTSGKPRIVYLTHPMRKLMAVLRRASTSEYVYLNGDSKPWTVNAVRQRIMRLKEKLGLAKDVCAYLVRHAFGTRSILRGNDVLTTSVLTGHSSANMVSSVYVHLANEQKHLLSAVERIRSAASHTPTTPMAMCYTRTTCCPQRTASCTTPAAPAMATTRSTA